VGIYENPPKIYTDASGSPSGFWSEIIKYIARKEGWQVIWVTGTWEEGLRRLENNEIDLMPDVAWSAARAEKFIISNEAILTSWARVYVLNANNIQTILDLDGKKVGGLQGSLNFDGPEGIKDLANRFGAKVNFISYQSYDDVFKAIQNQQVDAGITNKDFGDKNEKKYSLNRTPIIIQPAQLRRAFKKEDK
jgi:ABC-type amino acid transport substrate-binding protein